MLMHKDRAERLTIAFDFAAIVASLGLGNTVAAYAQDPTYFAEDYAAGVTIAVSAPTVELARDMGDDQLAKVGVANLAGSVVKQEVEAGTPDAVYDVACTVTLSNGDHRRLSHTLVVL